MRMSTMMMFMGAAMFMGMVVVMGFAMGVVMVVRM
jgi:hypothetical protein